MLQNLKLFSEFYCFYNSQYFKLRTNLKLKAFQMKVNILFYINFMDTKLKFIPLLGVEN